MLLVPVGILFRTVAQARPGHSFSVAAKCIVGLLYSCLAFCLRDMPGRSGQYDSFMGGIVRISSGHGYDSFMGGLVRVSSGQEAGRSLVYRIIYRMGLALVPYAVVCSAVVDQLSIVGVLIMAHAIQAYLYPHAVQLPWESGCRENALDFGGSLVLHEVGGIVAFMLATSARTVLGPLEHGGGTGQGCNLPPKKMFLLVIGQIAMTLGWAALVLGSPVMAETPSLDCAARGVANTLLAAISAACFTLLWAKCKFEPGVPLNYTILGMNGALSGMVSISASSAFVEGWAAVIISAVGAGVFLFSSGIEQLQSEAGRVAAETFAMHFGCGVWGAIAAGLFSRRTYPSQCGYRQDVHGLLYGGCSILLLWNILAATDIAVWTSFCSHFLGRVLKESKAYARHRDDPMVGHPEGNAR